MDLKARLIECKLALRSENLPDQSLATIESTGMSQAFRLAEEKLTVEAQKVEITELQTKLKDAGKALDKQAEEFTLIQKTWEGKTSDLKAQLVVANNKMEEMKVNMDKSRSSWERKVGVLTEELGRLRAVDGEAVGSGSHSEIDEEAALALTGMRGQTTPSQAHEVSPLVQVSGHCELSERSR